MPMFKVRPDLFPEGYLTMTEIILWGRYVEEIEKKGKKKKGKR